jgi:hypothetical protein
MMDFEALGRMFFSARFSLDVGIEGIAFGGQIPEEEIEECKDVLDDAAAKFKMISDALAGASGAICNGYVAANREALELGRQRSEQRAEKIALLRLAGDDTPEDQIPI